MTDFPETAYRAGYVTVVGRPNVGKSTLVNALVGHKVSITAPRPQTTRFQVLGIDTDERRQIVYIDTPGIHGRARKAMNRYLNRAAVSAIPFGDVTLLVVEAGRWRDDDERVLAAMEPDRAALMVAVNKIDRLPSRDALLPVLADLAGRLPDAELVPISALTGENLPALRRLIEARMPRSEPFYPPGQHSDRGLAFVVAEAVREQLFRSLRQELPYSTAVEVESMEEQGGRLHCAAVIWVDRPSHKPIVIGREGAGLKAIGSAARRELEQALGRKVDLRLWVKVKEGWADDERALRQLGYTLQ